MMRAEKSSVPGALHAGQNRNQRNEQTNSGKQGDRNQLIEIELAGDGLGRNIRRGNGGSDSFGHFELLQFISGKKSPLPKM